MRFDPVLAEIRFGCGLSPVVSPPESVKAVLDGLTAPDTMAERFPVETFETFVKRQQERLDLTNIRRQNRGSEEAAAAAKAIKVLNRVARKDHLVWMASLIARRIQSPTAFRERLEGFWADHFTAAGKMGLMRRAGTPYSESAIRPNLTGLFEDILIAAVTHPLMVHYLDQERSAGPNSQRAIKNEGKFGLNENLAREILELHTLGVDGPYTQADVTELAELLTGLTLKLGQGLQFRRDMAEPGAETVLGKTYGGDKRPHLRDIEAVLRDLARHPATARHLAGKLAVHFVSDKPDPALVSAIEAAFLETGCDLSAGYAAMLAHPSAWSPEGGNFKQPFDFISSACRALNVPLAAFQAEDEARFRQRIFHPMNLMGHIWQRPNGPDGLEEDDSAWITPQSMAARLQWAVGVPQQLVPDLPDPRDFVDVALGPRATERVRFAAKAAESRADGVGLILASPAFQRM